MFEINKEKLNDMASSYLKLKKIHILLGYEIESLRYKIKGSVNDQDKTETEDFIIYLRNNGTNYFKIVNKYQDNLKDALNSLKDIINTLGE